MQSGIPFPNLHPEIFSLSVAGVEFALRWYPLAYIFGILLGWRLVLVAIRNPRLWSDGPPVTAEQVDAYLTWLVVGILVGGRLGFVLFYQPAYFLANPIEIFMVWQGGMSFHGAALGILIAILLWCRTHGLALLSCVDLQCLAVAPGLFLGRIANFINAELWGRPTDLPWGVIFPGVMAQNCPGVVGLCARHPSQLYEAALEGLLLGLLLVVMVWRWRALSRPGLIFGTFLVGYGVARFAVEFVRQPDIQFVGPNNPIGHAIIFVPGYGLTMGQILCLPMIAVGLWSIAQAFRAPAYKPGART